MSWSCCEEMATFNKVMMVQRLRRVRWATVPALLLLLGGVAWGVGELPYVDWQPLSAPLDHAPLVIREDAKGDGRFDAPRSGNRRHHGLDLVGTIGEPVHAVRSGRIIRAGQHHGLGLFVQIQHRGHWRSLYAHLQTMAVSEGQRVRQGQIIGTVGKTGNAHHPWIMPHLHMELAHEGTPVDPSTMGLAVIQPARQGTEQEALGGE